VRLIYAASLKSGEFHFQNESYSASNSAVDLEVVLKGVLTFQFERGGGGRFIAQKVCTACTYKDKLVNSSLKQFE